MISTRNTATSPWVNRREQEVRMTAKPAHALIPARTRRPAFVVAGNPGCRRVALFQEALARRRLPAATLVPYIDLIAGRATLEQVVWPGTVVRLESPGRDFEVEKALLAS